MKKTIAIIVLMFSLHSLNAQDIHLSQYYTSNTSLNPAFTGFYDGDLRFTGNYRSQWGQVNVPINTNMFSVEKRIRQYAHEFGIGLLLVNDRVSQFALNTNKAMLSLAYQKEIGGFLVRVGGQGGYVMKSSDLSGQTFPGQWNYTTGQFDESVNSGESLTSYNYSYIDINGGFSVSKKIKNKLLTAGYALFHINRPKEDILVSGSYIPFRHVFTAQADMKSSNQLYTFTPRLLYMHASGATDMVTGINVKRKLTDDLSALVGASFRSNIAQSDALIAILGASYKRVDFAVSMDFNVSKLSQDGPYKSTYEFSIIYTTPSVSPDKIALPCDRY